MRDSLPRLLMVFSFLSHTSGSHSVAEDLANKLRDETERIIQVSPFRSGLLRSLHMAATTLWRRRDYDVAIIGLYSGRAFLWGETVAALLHWLGRPFVISMHGGALPEFAAQNPERVKNTLRKATAVTAPSHYLLERMRPYCDEILLLPNPIDLHRYEFLPRRAPQPRLIWLRAFHEIYNPKLAVEVLNLLKAEFPALHLTMVGPDKGDGSRQQTVEAAQSLGMQDRLTMPGGVANSEVPQWLNRGDIFLNTTNVDNTPVSVIEAMAGGLCIVSTNAGGLPYLLEDGEDALLVPPNDPGAMAAAVRRLLTEAGLAERLSRNARRKAESFDWSAVLPQWRTLLRRVAWNQYRER
ncbi:MAG TPA: glycosyltransferase [Blastocatellia bacterium]|nr:glycosyltransferase [Blastocatellia bacterium]HMX29178.1 glycosyltransferase [Blastocatellia bacterium]HMY73061.1 glycosyltransferase [Blastocatellia bacterium]HMZ22175.1 glycosyltransferase [Blastocatellia bacterium]HNG28575.1 glycosyltransferase [Blastocatellia bacterium]